jgi:hypothetical protein
MQEEKVMSRRGDEAGEFFYATKKTRMWQRNVRLRKVQDVQTVITVIEKMAEVDEPNQAR